MIANQNQEAIPETLIQERNEQETLRVYEPDLKHLLISIRDTLLRIEQHFEIGTGEDLK